MRRRASKGISLLLVLSGYVAAQLKVIDVERAVITRPDGGIASVEGGAWLNDERVTSVSHELVRLRAENAEFRTAPPPATGTAILIAVIVGLVTGAALGAWAGYELGKK